MIPGSGRSPGEGNSNLLQDPCLGNSVDKGAWQATVHMVSRVGPNLATTPPPCTTSTVSVPKYLPTNGARGSFLSTLANTCYAVFLDNSHSVRCEVILTLFFCLFVCFWLHCMTCWIYFPNQGLNLGHSSEKCGVLTMVMPGNSPHCGSDCVSLEISDVHLFMCLLAICLLYRKKIYSGPLSIFPLGCLFFMLGCIVSSLYILDINSLSDLSFANISSHSVGSLFLLLVVFFAVQKLLSMI